LTALCESLPDYLKLYASLWTLVVQLFDFLESVEVRSAHVVPHITNISKGITNIFYFCAEDFTHHVQVI